jgi:hypothetical protein
MKTGVREGWQRYPFLFFFKKGKIKRTARSEGRAQMILIVVVGYFLTADLWGCYFEKLRPFQVKLPNKE